MNDERRRPSQKRSLELTLLSVALLSTFVSLGQVALAQCEEPPRGPVEVVPASGAFGVTLDAFVRVRYQGEDLMAGESRLELRRCGEMMTAAMCATQGTLVQGAATVSHGEWLFFQPSSPLQPNSLYAGVARGNESNLVFQFTTGSLLDTAPPSLGPIVDPGAGITVDPCTGASQTRIDLRFAPAQDDGPAGSIEYLAYVTRAPGLAAPELRVRRRSFVTTEVAMAFTVSDEEASGEICVVVHAVDGVGKVDNDMQPLCFMPSDQVVFDGLCSAHAMSPSDAGLLALLGILLLRRRVKRG